MPSNSSKKSPLAKYDIRNYAAKQALRRSALYKLSKVQAFLEEERYQLNQHYHLNTSFLDYIHGNDPYIFDGYHSPHSILPLGTPKPILPLEDAHRPISYKHANYEPDGYSLDPEYTSRYGYLIHRTTNYHHIYIPPSYSRHKGTESTKYLYN